MKLQSRMVNILLLFTVFQEVFLLGKMLYTRAPIYLKYILLWLLYIHSSLRVDDMV